MSSMRFVSFVSLVSLVSLVSVVSLCKLVQHQGEICGERLSLPKRSLDSALSAMSIVVLFSQH